MLYEELGERGRRESSVREIPLEAYVYAYMKLIHSSCKYVIDTHLHDKKCTPYHCKTCLKQW
jgi:hypothetical protein